MPDNVYNYVVATISKGDSWSNLYCIVPFVKNEILLLAAFNVAKP